MVFFPMFGFIFHRNLFLNSINHKKIMLVTSVQFKMQALNLS